MYRLSSKLSAPMQHSSTNYKIKETKNTGQDINPTAWKPYLLLQYSITNKPVNHSVAQFYTIFFNTKRKFSSKVVSQANQGAGHHQFISVSMRDSLNDDHAPAMMQRSPDATRLPSGLQPFAHLATNPAKTPRINAVSSSQGNTMLRQRQLPGPHDSFPPLRNN